MFKSTMKLLRKLQNFTVWNFYWVRHLHRQTSKGSHIEKEPPCANLVKMHFWPYVCVCFSLHVYDSKGDAIWMKIQIVSHEARMRHNLHSVLTSWHWSGKRKEPETGCEAGQKGFMIIGGDGLASLDLRDADTVPHHLLWLFYIQGMKKAWRVGDFPLE